MKLVLLILFMALSNFTSAGTESLPICSYLHSGKIMKRAMAHSKNDKNRHCAVSCMLTRRCPVNDVLSAGILKEMKDVVGPGNAELADMKANLMGIDFALLGRVRSDRDCFRQCDLYY